MSNADALIHDGNHGRDRFLMLEAKMPREPDLQLGQRRLLTALARGTTWTVRLLHSLKGERDTLRYHRVTPDRVETPGIIVPRSRFREAVAAWLSGDAWADPSGEREAELARPSHVRGWARSNGVWRCIQDYYAEGYKPATGCGRTWQEVREAVA